MCLVLMVNADINGQSCVDVVNVLQQGINASVTCTQVIVAEYNISCDGRITGYLMHLSLNKNGSEGYPTVQVWCPINQTSSVYSIVGTAYALSTDNITTNIPGDGFYYLGNVSCTGTNRTEFQTGDVIEYHKDDLLHYRLWNNATREYTSYCNKNTSLTDHEVGVNLTLESMQPLIQIMYGKIRKAM